MQVAIKETTEQKALEFMLKSVHQFIKMLREEAGSQEEEELIQEYVQKIGEM